MPGRFDGYDIEPVAVLAAKVQAFYDGIQPPGSDPMLDFDDRDLVRHAEDAGFAEVHLDLRVDVEAALKPCPWDLFLRQSGNPLEPPFGEVLAQVLDPAEAAEFTAHLRPLVESGAGQLRRAVAYLVAVKGTVGAAGVGRASGARARRTPAGRAMHAYVGRRSFRGSGGRRAVPGPGGGGRGGWAALGWWCGCPYGWGCQ